MYIKEENKTFKDILIYIRPSTFLFKGNLSILRFKES
jgi:hypothetical protein